MAKPQVLKSFWVMSLVLVADVIFSLHRQGNHQDLKVKSPKAPLPKHCWQLTPDNFVSGVD